MGTINGLDKMSYAELVKLQQRIEAAIAAKRVEDAAATKEQLRAMAEMTCLAIAARRAAAKPNTAIPRILRKPGPAAAASPTGWWMP